MTDRTDEDRALPPRPSPPLDAPDAASLVEAVAAWLHDDLMPRSVGPDRWTLRIAANALSLAAREVGAAAEVTRSHAERLAALGYDSERALSMAIRAGDEDDRFAEILDAVAAGVADALAVANPGYRSD